jgi:hypothetical protein
MLTFSVLVARSVRPTRAKIACASAIAIHQLLNVNPALKKIFPSHINSSSIFSSQHTTASRHNFLLFLGASNPTRSDNLFLKMKFASTISALLLSSPCSYTQATTIRRRLSYERIAGYEPRSQVTDQNSIDLDQQVRMVLRGMTIWDAHMRII